MRDGVQYDTQIGDFMAQTEKIRRNSQNLRKNMTKEERHLWYDFLKTYPVPFHRQYTFENYIVDFYCHQARLILELDGSQHCSPEKMEYDCKRTAFLESKGLYVLRISNLDVMRQFRATCDMIDLAVQSRLHR
jgi:very-short-patch-repair endonuclease